MEPSSRGLYGRQSNPVVVVPLALMLTIVMVAFGYYLLGLAEHAQDPSQPVWPFFDCLYFTVISLTTVGYGETLAAFDGNIPARVYTIAVLLIGYAIVVWAFSSIVAVLVEGRFREHLGRKRMLREIQQLTDHHIICGLGDTGVHVLEELRRTLRDVVVVERSHERLSSAQREIDLDYLFIEGDAEDESALRDAGIEQAAGLVACLPEDKDNIYLVMTARQLNPNLRIAARATHMESIEKLRRAGADVVVSPNYIGGLRIASEMARPRVTSFLDVMLRDKSNVIRLEEVIIPENSPAVERTIKQVDIHRKTGLLILATLTPERDEFRYNPGPDFVLEAGMTLIVLGNVKNVAQLRELVGV